MAATGARRALLFIGAGALALIVLVAIGLGALATSPGRSMLAGVIERVVRANGISVSITNLSGWPPFRFGAEKIVIADTDGPFAEIDNMTAEMRFGDLLTGAVAFDSIAAERIAIQRQPIVPSSESEQTTGLAVERFSVVRLELGEALVGQPAALFVAGSYAAQNTGRIRLNVNVERIDGRTGSLNATLARARSAAPLVADVKLDEGADGILPRLLGSDAGPAYRLAAKSEAIDRPGGLALEGTLTLASTGTAQFDGRFSLALSGDGKRLIASGDGDLGELLPPDWSGVMAGPLHIAIDASWSQAKNAALPRIEVREGVVRSATLRAQASGRLDVSTATASDLVLKLDAGRPDGAALIIPGTGQAVRVGTLALTGRALDVNGRPGFEVAGSIAGFAAPDIALPRTDVSLTVSSAGSDPFAGGKLPYTLRIGPDAIESPAGRIRSTAATPIALVAEGTFDTAKAVIATKASLALAGARATFDGEIAGPAINGAAHVQVADLRTLAPFAGRALAGTLELKASGAFAAPAGTRLDIVADATNLDPGDATLARLLAGKAHFAAKFARGTGGAQSFSLADAVIDSNALKASGKATLAATTVDATVEGRLSDLSVLARDTQGVARFALKASGSRSAPNIESTVRVDDGKLLGKPVERVLARLDGRPVAKGWAGKLAVEGRYAGKRIDGGADATLETATGLLDVPRIEIAVGDNRIRGNLRRNARGMLDGTLDLVAPDIATLAALALVDASGSATAKVTLNSAGARQALALTFAGNGVKVQDVAIGSAEGKADIDDPFNAPRIRGNVDATAIAIGEFKIDAATLRASVAAGATRFSASAKNADLDLAATGALTSAANANRLALETLTGSAYRVPVRLVAPTAIEFGGDRVAIRDARLAAGAGGTLRIDGVVAPEFDVAITADKVAANLANIFAPKLGAEGTLTGRADIRGKTATPTIAWQVDGTGLRVAATRGAGLPALALSARGDATMTEASIDARLSGAGATFTAKGRIPYSGSGLSVQAAGTAPLALLALESDRELRLGGSVRINVAVTGALAAPQITGDAEFVDAMIADTDTAFGVTGLTGRVVFDGQRATLQQVAGRLLQGGQVTLGGSIDTAQRNLPSALTLRVDNGRYADGRTVSTAFSGSLKLDGPLLGDSVISGSITLGRTEIQLTDKLGGSASAIEVKHVRTQPGFRDPLRRRESVDTSTPRSGTPKLSIELTNTGGIFVRGFGVDGEFGGSLRLAGTVASPEAAGAFTMRRGRIELLGKRFDLTSGRLTFAGDLIPLLDFTGTATSGTTTDFKATLTVTGPATDPVISLSSIPELPQEEVLSRLLFDRSVGSLSPLQAVQLIDALARFTGVTSGSSMFDRIRRATGLDDLDVRQNAAGATTVGVGRRLGDRVRLGVEAGTGTTAGRVTVDLEITKELKARGEAGYEGTGKVGLSYEHEY